MRNFFIIANWKSHKDSVQAKDWLGQLAHLSSHDITLILCPPFTLLQELNTLIKQHNFPIHIGAQDISPFNEGPYTGEVSGEQIREFAEYVLVGHSERRMLLGESDALIAEKVARALENKLTPIFFMQNIATPIPQGVTIVVYEPASAISTVSNGVGVDPQEVEKVAQEIKKTYNIHYVLYGGSVSPENIGTYKKLPSVDGVIPGKASLDPKQFTQIVNNV